MIIISSCVCGGRQTVLNYFADPSFSPNPVTFRWKNKPRFSWNYTVSGRGDPFFTDEEFLNLTPGQPLWYDLRNSYPNYAPWTKRTTEKILKDASDWYNKYAGTLYDYLNGKYQIVSVDLTDFMGLSRYAKENSKELTTWWIDTPKEIVVKGLLEKHSNGTQTITNFASSPVYGDISRTVRAMTEEEAEDRYNSHRKNEELLGVFSKGSTDKIKELEGQPFTTSDKSVNVTFEWSGPDEIVENNGTIEELHEKLRVLYQKYTT